MPLKYKGMRYQKQAKNRVYMGIRLRESTFQNTLFWHGFAHMPLKKIQHPLFTAKVCVGHQDVEKE